MIRGSRAALSMGCCVLLAASAGLSGGEDPAAALSTGFRRPVALAAVDDWLVTANRRSGTVSVIDTRRREVVAEPAIAAMLSDLKAVGDGRWLVAVSESDHVLVVLRRRGPKLEVVERVPVADFPVSICVAGDATRCTVASLWSRRLTFVQLERAEGGEDLDAAITQVLDLPFAPRAQLLVADGAKLLVADSFGGRLAVIDAERPAIERVVTLPGHNIRGLAIAPGGRELLIAQQILNGQESTTRDNVFWGGVMLNVVRSVPLEALLTEDSDESPVGTMMPFGYPSKATGDPAGLLVTSDGRTLVSLGGVDEVAVQVGLRPFRHQAVGRRPTALAAATQPDVVYVANALDDSISVLEGRDLQTTATIRLGPQPEHGPVERGEALFYDARLSLDGWFSCHSCHTDGHTNGLVSDTSGDGHFGAPKRVLSLLGAGETQPWAWNGRSENLPAQVHKSILQTMQGEQADDQTVQALVAFLETLPPPPGLAIARHTADPAQVRRGRRVFARLGCADCHVPPEYTSPATYDVGLEDALGTREFNPPSLLGASQRGPYFHDNRAADLRAVFARFQHGLGGAALSDEELNALLAFLESL